MNYYKYFTDNISCAKTLVFLLIVFFQIFILSGCLTDEPSASGELMGKVVDKDGKNIKGATVKIFKSNYTAGNFTSDETGLEFKAVSNSDGTYKLPKLEKGEYHILATKDKMMGLQDSVFFYEDMEEVPNVVLKEAATIKGKLQISYVNDTLKLRAQIPGTDLYKDLEVLEDGSFTIESIPQGELEIKFLTNIAGYDIEKRTIIIDKLNIDITKTPIELGYNLKIKGGRVLLKNGDPAPGATVKFFNINYVPGELLLRKPSIGSGPDYQTETDGNGYYNIPQISDGSYNVIAEMDGEAAMEDSVFINDKVDFIEYMTLKEPGDLKGTVKLQPNHDPRTTIVNLLGTNYFSNVNADGSFEFKNIPEGFYFAKITTSVENYTSIFVSVKVLSNETSILKDPLMPIYTGIPVVENIYSSYDTLNGVVTLSWDSVDYGSFKEFVIYRRTAGTLNPEDQLIGRTEKLSIKDTIFQESQRFNVPIDYQMKFEYLVQAVSKSEDEGPKYFSALQEVVSPKLVETVINFNVSGAVNNTATINDSIFVAGNYSNPNLKNKRIQWFLNGKLLKIVKNFYLTRGSNNFQFVCTQVRDYWIKMEIVDEKGIVWMDSTKIHVIYDRPKANISVDVENISINDSVVLNGSGQDFFGKIIKYQWVIGEKKDTLDQNTNKIKIAAPEKITKNYPCILIVTDDDGFTGTTLLNLNVTNFSPVINISEYKMNRSDFYSETYIKATAIDKDGEISSMSWDVFSDGKKDITSDGSIAFGNQFSEYKIMTSVFEAIDEDGNISKDTAYTEFTVPGQEKETSTNFFKMFPSIGEFREQNDIIFYNNEYLYLGDDGAIYTSTDGIEWETTKYSNSLLTNEMGYRYKGKMILFDNSIYILGGGTGTTLDEVWTTVDLFEWRKLTSGAAFTGTLLYKCIVYQNKMMLLTDKGVFSSVDGSKWLKILSNNPLGSNIKQMFTFDSNLYFIDRPNRIIKYSDDNLEILPLEMDLLGYRFQENNGDLYLSNSFTIWKTKNLTAMTKIYDSQALKKMDPKAYYYNSSRIFFVFEKDSLPYVLMNKKINDKKGVYNHNIAWILNTGIFDEAN